MVAEKSAVGGEGRGMCGLENEMARTVDESAFFLSETAPEDEDKVFLFFGKVADDGVGKLLPPLALMRPCLMGAHG